MAVAVLLVVVGLSFVISGITWAYFFAIGAKWTSVPGVTFSRALYIAMVVHTSFVTIELAQMTSEPDATFMVVMYLSLFAGELFFIRWAIKSTLWQAFKSWLPTLLSGVINVLMAFLVIRPFVFEAFTVPTNSMAPTILGQHEYSNCPDCDAKAYTWVDNRRADRSIRQMKRWYICDNFHLFESDKKSRSGDGDRFLASKLLRPNRWDIIVFKFPGDRKMKNVKRVVGLPGETILIKDGGIWVNGDRLNPPASIDGITYADVTFGLPVLHGHESVTLAMDEYFVLGDFTMGAKDSRYWDKSEVRPLSPYAVVDSEIIGVATFIYGNRWHSLAP